MGLNVENLKLLVEGIKRLPSSLESFNLGLERNILGENEENLKLLVEGIRELPKNLKSLVLSLRDNDIDIKYL